MKLLMHICCANCAIYPIRKIRDEGIYVEGFWFNPNIHPFKEYEARLGSVRMLQTLVQIDIHYKDHYGLVDFIRGTAYREHYRCRYCYNIRLEETAIAARMLGMEGFTTSLLISPYQDVDMLIETGSMLAIRHNVEFYKGPFREGFYAGRRQGREMGFYQQKYCGCIYSEMERYGRH